MKIHGEGETGNIDVSNIQYIKDLLKKYNMEKYKATSVPLGPGYQVACTKEYSRTDILMYQSLIGKLMYLAIRTR